MQQLQMDKDYTMYLIRTIKREISSNKFQTKEQLVGFINNIRNEINKDEIRKYVQDNNLRLDYQAFELMTRQIVESFGRSEMQVNGEQNKNIQPINLNQQSNIQFGSPINQQEAMVTNNFLSQQPPQKPNYVRVTDIDVNAVPKETIEKINFLIVGTQKDVTGLLVDTATGRFVDGTTGEEIAIRKNSETGAYELVSKQSEEQQLQTDKSLNGAKEVEPLQVEKQKVKVKKLVMPNIIENNKAYISTVLITAVCAISGIVIASFLLVK